MTANNIPISETTLARLRELARWSGSTLDDALDRAIKDQYDQQFWPAANAGYDALRADAAAWAEIEADRKLWDNTLMDGLDSSERWTAEGDVLPSSKEETSV